MQKAKTSNSVEREKSVFIKDGYEWIKVNLAELVYVEGVITMSSSTKQKKITTWMTPGEAEEKLQPDIFIRVHKSSLSTFRRLKKLIANK